MGAVLNKIISVYRAIRLRLYKKRFEHIGEGTYIVTPSRISHPERLSIGKEVRINKDVHISAPGGVVIGDRVTLSSHVKIVTSTYDLEQWVETGQRRHILLPVNIGDDCWIGTGAIILPGVCITGRYVVVAAGAVVTKNITENKVIYGGVPAGKIKTL